MLQSRHEKAPWVGRLGGRDALKKSLEMSVHTFGGVAFAAADRVECLDRFVESVVFDDVIKLGGSREFGASGLEPPLDLFLGFCAAPDKALNHRVPRGGQQEDQRGLVSKDLADLSSALDVDIEQDVVALTEKVFGGAAACPIVVVVNTGPFEKSFALDHLLEGVFGDKVVVDAVLFVVSGRAGGVGDGESVAGRGVQKRLAKGGFSGTRACGDHQQQTFSLKWRGHGCGSFLGSSHSIFWTCSRIFSISALMGKSRCVMGPSWALTPMVVASRCISWQRKSRRLPITPPVSRSWRNCVR